MESAHKPKHTLNELSTQLRARLPISTIGEIEVLENTDSTNAALMQRPFSHHPNPSAMLWALRQTSGRGRRGRVWQSHPEHALTFSICFESEVRDRSKLASLSPAAGLALARELSRIAPGIQVKWPNDLWRGGKKIAGVLLEATQRGRIQRVVIGIGINLFWPHHEALQAPALGVDSSALRPQEPGGMFEQPASLEGKLNILGVCAKTMAELYRQAQDATHPSAAWFSDWHRFDALADQQVYLYQDQQLIANGVNAGVDIDGAFLLNPRTAISGHSEQSLGSPALQRFEIGEVSLRAAGLPGSVSRNPVKIVP
jgi:BirA family transcriptional regulator, biotin operon repressor / biotin---[acetyl-CoA-carboxylase] ligase